jgi:outer membrane murein-binding lipoprotein Lpp
VCAVINRFFNKLALLIPGFSVISAISLLVAGVIGFIKAAAFVMHIITAQAKIDELEQKNQNLQQQVIAKQQELERKEA